MKSGKKLQGVIRVLPIVLATTFAMTLSGCVLVPFIQAFKEVGATEGDRMALLDKEIKGFNSAIVWGNHTEAASYVAPESQLKLSSQLKDTSEEERIVDTKVTNVVWGEGAREASVKVKTKFYRVPVYVVNTRTEEQKWTWNSGSWKLVDRSVQEG
ncbi:MAG: hypothetical protein RL518_639 [Pseudomonadota bacterium]|jgi:hypothetical protein